MLTLFYKLLPSYPNNITLALVQVNRHKAQLMRKISLIILLGLALPLGAASPEFTLKGERMTLRAYNNSLPEVLSKLQRYGVKVEIDPSIQAKIDGDLVDIDIEKGMQKLLGSLGYVITWDRIHGPHGSWPRLSAITVFHPGFQNLARPLTSDRSVYNVVESKGQRYVADELLIGMKVKTSRADFQALLDTIGGSVVSGIPSLGIYRITLPQGSNVPALVDALKANALVAAIEPNYVVDSPPQKIPTDSTAQNQNNSPKVSTPLGSTKIAVLDSGLKTDASLGNLVSGTFDSTNPGMPINDNGGHGTQMAYIASGAIQPTGTTASENPNANILAIKAFDDNGVASNYGLIESLNYAQENGARILSLSWGTETPSTFLKTAFQQAAQNGALIFAAAGNEPTGNPVYPAAYAETIAVAALGADGTRWKKSNYGDFVDFIAPGHATFPVGNNGPPGAYQGTSIATPYLANWASQYASQNPSASNEDIINALKAAVVDAGPSGKDPQYGYGVFNSAAAENFLK